MPTPTSTHYDIRYDLGWVIVTDGIMPDGKEIRMVSARDRIRHKMIADGRYGKGIRVTDETKAMEAWERRRTRKGFVRPKGMFLFRIVDSTGEHNIGRSELHEWPQGNLSTLKAIEEDTLNEEGA